MKRLFKIVVSGLEGLHAEFVVGESEVKQLLHVFLVFTRVDTGFLKLLEELNLVEGGLVENRLGDSWLLGLWFGGLIKVDGLLNVHWLLFLDELGNFDVVLVLLVVNIEELGNDLFLNVLFLENWCLLFLHWLKIKLKGHVSIVILAHEGNWCHSSLSYLNERIFRFWSELLFAGLTDVKVRSLGALVSNSYDLGITVLAFKVMLNLGLGLSHAVECLGEHSLLLLLAPLHDLLLDHLVKVLVELLLEFSSTLALSAIFALFVHLGSVAFEAIWETGKSLLFELGIICNFDVLGDIRKEFVEEIVSLRLHLELVTHRLSFGLGLDHLRLLEFKLDGLSLDLVNL